MIDNDPLQLRTFLPSRLAAAGRSVVFLAGGTLVGAVASTQWPRFPNTILGGLLGAVLFGIGCRYAANALLNLPRLVVAPDEVRIHTLFGTTCARWDSLSVWYIETEHDRSGSHHIVSAAIIGPNVSNNISRDKLLTIHDVYQTSVDEIVATLNRSRVRAVGEY